jgi:hypothetical protein
MNRTSATHTASLHSSLILNPIIKKDDSKKMTVPRNTTESITVKNARLISGLPDGIFSNQKSQFG